MGVAHLGPLAHQLEGALGLPEPAHAVEDAAGPEALLGDHEARTTLAEEVVLRHADVVERTSQWLAAGRAHGGTTRTIS